MAQTQSSKRTSVTKLSVNANARVNARLNIAPFFLYTLLPDESVLKKKLNMEVTSSAFMLMRYWNLKNKEKSKNSGGRQVSLEKDNLWVVLY